MRGYINKIFEEWPDKDSEQNKSLSGFLYTMFAHFENHRDFYELLNKCNLIYLLKDVIIGICEVKPKQPKEEAYGRAYAAYVLYGWIEVWFECQNWRNKINKAKKTDGFPEKRLKVIKDAFEIFKREALLRKN